MNLDVLDVTSKATGLIRLDKFARIFMFIVRNGHFFVGMPSRNWMLFGVIQVLGTPGMATS